MSFDTYISLMLGDLIALAFTICIPIIQTRKNKEGNRQLKFLKRLFLIPVILALLLTIAFFTSSAQQKRSEYSQLISDASFDLNNHNFLDAAEHYHQASVNSYDSDTFLEAIYCEGMCYFLHATENSEFEYYQKAARIYSNIIKNQEYSSSEYYVDAVADMSEIYYFLGYSWDDPEWIQLVSLLESMVFSEDIELSAHDKLSLKLKVTYALGLYYEHAAYSDFDNFMNPDFASKALIYYEEFNYLYKLTAETKSTPIVPALHTANILNIVDFIFIYAITSERPEYFSTAVKLCETELNRINTANMNIAEYIELKENIGKGYIFLSYAHDDQKNIYLQKAYQTLSPTMKINDENAIAALMDIGYYLVRTNLCSEEEINRIIDTYEYNLSQISVSSDANTRIKVLLSACSVYKWLLENYDYYSCALECGLRYSDELNNQFGDLLSSDDKLSAQEYYAFFTTIKLKNQQTP